jgi:ketosteroid isomerase-like protein
MNEANKQVALTFLHALCRGDVDTLNTVIAQDIVAILPGTAQIAGTRGYAEVMAICAMFPQISKAGLRPTVLNVTAEDDRVAIEWEGECTLLNGKIYNNVYHMLFFIRDGKVARMKEYLDTKMADEVIMPFLASMA